MKKLFVLLSALCLFACNKQEFEPQAVDQSELNTEENEYVMTLSGAGVETKAGGSISVVNMYLADLVSGYDSDATLRAQLRKKVNGEFVDVADTDAGYLWNDSGADYYVVKDSNVPKHHILTPTKSGSGKSLTVSGIVNGKTVAVSSQVEIKVHDDRALQWTSYDSSLDGGQIGSAVLTANFSDRVTVTAPDGVLIGTGTNPSSSSATVSFDENHRSFTFNYKYIGSASTTVSVSAKLNGDTSISDSFSCSVQPNVYHYKVTYKVGALFPLDADQIDFFNEFRRLYPLDDDDYRYYWNETSWSYKFIVGVDNQPSMERTIQGSMTLSFDSNFRISTADNTGVTLEFDSLENSATVYLSVETCSFGYTSFFYSNDMITFYKYYDDNFFNNRTYSIIAGNDSVDGIIIRNNVMDSMTSQAHTTLIPGNSTITLYLDLP